MKSWVEISAAKLAENFRAIQIVVGQSTEVLGIVKADAYGHGAAICSRVLVDAGARWLGVTDAEEGARVREALGQGATRVMVMSGMELADATAIVQNGLTPVIWTPEHVAALDRAARSAGHRICVHLEVETGMARQGAAPGPELERTLERLAASRWVSCEGVMTHLCSSEVAGSEVTLRQRDRFSGALAQITAAGLKPQFIHLSNTSAIDEGSTLAWLRETARAAGARAMVRPGLALYGLALPLEGAGMAQLAPRLSPVLCWRTHITGLRNVEPGNTVGYGATFTAMEPMRLALLPVGYADGFRRAASSGLGDGWVVIAKRRAHVVGRVSMNLTVVDVTGIAGVREGMDVMLLGDGVSAEDHARWNRTISYDILCGIRAHFVQR